MPATAALRRALVTLVLVLAASSSAAQDPVSPARPQPRDPFADGVWLREISAQVLAESWNYNSSREELYGGAIGLGYGVRCGLVVTLTWPVLYVSQRGADAYLLGMTGGMRWRLIARGAVAGYVEASLGLSRGEIALPPRGTRVNYLLVAGAGMTAPIPGGGFLMAGVRWLHVSNNGLAGRDRNPDIQALGVHAGVLLPF